MHDLFHRLYQTKLVLLALIFTFSGVALLVAAHWPGFPAGTDTGWLEFLPLTDLGSALFTTGLVVIAFEYIDGKDREARVEEQLRAVLSSEAPAMRDAVIAGFAFKPDDLARVSSPATLDQIAENSLAIQLGDKELAADVYRDIHSQVVRAGERWEDVRVTVSLAPWESAESEPRDRMFVATIRWEYKVVPTSRVRRFACVSDLDEYRELSQEDASNWVWRRPDVGTLTARSREAFELIQFSVNGQERHIRRALRARGQIYTANLGEAAATGEQVVISYTYRTLVQQLGHVLHIDFDQPSRDVTVELRHDACGIRRITVLDYLASGQSARLERTPNGPGGESVSVATEGWIVPPAGVAFVWVLEREYGRQAQGLGLSQH